MTVADSEFIDKNIIEELQKRTLGIDPLEVIFPISATQILNSQIAVSFRSSLQKKLWEFLIPDMEGEEFLLQHDKAFITAYDEPAIRAFYLYPYVQTNLLINECINLEMKLVNGNIKLEEKEGSYKDRFTSISYMNWVISYFDLELLKDDSGEDDLDALLAVTKIIN